MGISIIVAMISAALFAVTTNLQREAASAVPVEAGGPVRLVRRLLLDRRWLLGGLIGTLALGLHAAALSGGGVLVVQSVMTLGLVLALTLEAVRSGRRLHSRELGGAVLIAVGVAAVVVAGRPPGSGPAVGRPIVLGACAAVVLGALTLVVRSRRAVGGTLQARMLAGAAGACFAVDAVFLRQATTAWRAVTWGAVTWGAVPAATPAGLLPVAAGVAGFLVASMVGGVAVQRAYQVAPLRCVQPAVAAAEPVTAFLVGVLLLHEGVRWGAAGCTLLLTGIAALVAGIVTGLSPSAPRPADHRRVGPRPLTADVLLQHAEPSAAVIRTWLPAQPARSAAASADLVH